jgi:hypothetical protein
MRSNKFLLEQTGQSYLVKDLRGVTTRIGDTATDGKSILTGSGDPASALGKDGEVYIDIANFKIFTKSAGSWSAGSNFNGRSVLFGNGAPLNTNGRDLETYIDLDDFKIHTKSAGSWSAGTLFKGSNGSAGQDGLSLRFGNGAPSAGLGINNEVYLDLDSFKVHTKSAGSWSAGSLFKGSDGLAGQDGLSLRFGNGAPSSGIGVNNEVYLDLDSFKVHTKSAGSWSAGSLFKGSDGAQGPTGLTGLTGATGPKGDTGNAGSNGTGIYSTTLIAEGGTPSSNTAYGTTGADDLLIDSTNHKIYKRSASGATFTWALQGTQFRGAAGATGPAAITGYLSNESHTVTANPDGTGFSLVGAGGTFYVNSGSSTVTAQNYYVGAVGTSTSEAQNKLTLSINSSGVYTLSGGSWDSDSESFTLRAISGSTTVSKTYNIVKNKSSKSLSLVASALTFSKNGAGSFYPSGQSITLTPQMQNLSSTTITWTVKKIISGTPTTLSLPNVSYITLTAGSSPSATLTSTQFNSATGGVVGAQLQVTAAHADGVSDTVTIGVVSDGSETDIYCASLGTDSSPTDQRVPWSDDVGGGTGLRLSDVKADVGSIITADEVAITSYTSPYSSLGSTARPSASYTYNFSVISAITGLPVDYTTTVNHRLDGMSLTSTQTVFTVAVAGQYRITWQGSFRLLNYDPANSRDSTCYMSMLKASAANNTSFAVIDEISVDLTSSAQGTTRTAATFNSAGVAGSPRNLALNLSATGADAWKAKNYIGNKYCPDYDYVLKVTTLKLAVGDKIIFKARKSQTSGTILRYDLNALNPDDYPTSPTYKYRDATEAWINANTAADDETERDIDTIVMFQRVAD